MLVLAVFNIHSMKHAILICELRKDLRLKDRNLKIRNLTWVWDPDPWQNQIKSSTKTQPWSFQLSKLYAYDIIWHLTGSPRFNEQWGHDLWQTRWCPHWNRGHRRRRQSQRAEANSWMEARSCAWGCHAPPESNVKAGVCCLAALLSDSVRFWLCIFLTPQKNAMWAWGVLWLNMEV